MQQSNALRQSSLSDSKLIHRGKVRDMYDVNDNFMLLIATDRLSSSDIVLDQPIPGKGEVLTRLSRFWFGRTRGIVENHLSNIPLIQVIESPEEREQLGDRVMIVRKLKPLPIEAIVRGYLIGSGWGDYQKTGSVCGIRLPEDLALASKLPEAIYTPSTKAAIGEHDENISFAESVKLLGPELAGKVRTLSLRLYTECAEFALTKGIIIADTKFEFGVDELGDVHLIDEVLTPDSSRFWPADKYKLGVSPESFDKQIIRDYLAGIGWDETSSNVIIPSVIIQKTAERYREAERMLTGK